MVEKYTGSIWLSYSIKGEQDTLLPPGYSPPSIFVKVLRRMEVVFGKLFEIQKFSECLL